MKEILSDGGIPVGMSTAEKLVSAPVDGPETEEYFTQVQYTSIMNLFALAIDPKEVTVFDEPKQWLETHGINIVIIIVGAWIVRRLGVAVLTSFLNKAIRSHQFATETDRKKRMDTLDSLLSAISKVVIGIVMVIMIIDELGINTAPLLASAGVVGVALGIGAQSLIKDFTNGLFIIIENQYRVGDFVQFDTTQGVVQAITIRTTILKDFDGNVHHVPNSSIIVATNMTFGTSGINQDVTVSMDTDIDKLEKVINQVGEDMIKDEKLGPKIKRAPYFAQVVQFAERGLMVKILGETMPGAQWKVKTELLKNLRQAFLDNNIDLPMSPRADKLTKSTKKTSK